MSSWARASVAHAMAREVSFARGATRSCSSLNVTTSQAGSAQRQILLRHRITVTCPKHGA